jgi:hypothetical protein
MKREEEKRVESAEKETAQSEERRRFLKKAVYEAPKLIILGEIAKPIRSEAGFGPPPSDPSWGCPP